MKIVLIWGVEGSGKTTTCRKLLKTLLSLGGDSVSYEVFFYDGNISNDFKSLLLLDNKKIAIYSAGDEKGHIRNAVKFGEGNACDVLIGTWRHKVHFNEPLEGYVQNKDWFRVNLTGTETPSEQNAAENSLIPKILEKIFEL